MTRKIMFCAILLLSTSSYAEIEINRIWDSEIAKCQNIIDLKSILAYSLVAEWGNFSEDRVKQRLSPEQYSRFLELLQSVKPYLQHLAKDGQVMDEPRKNDLSLECAALAKSALLVGMLKLSPATSESHLAK